MVHWEIIDIYSDTTSAVPSKFEKASARVHNKLN